MYVSQWSEGTKGRGKLSQGRKAPPDRPALKPYWRKFNVRNFRGDHGNIGIIEARLAPWSYPTADHGNRNQAAHTDLRLVARNRGVTVQSLMRPSQMIILVNEFL
jgi:hypothetical protein